MQRHSGTSYMTHRNASHMTHRNASTSHMMQRNPGSSSYTTQRNGAVSSRYRAHPTSARHYTHDIRGYASDARQGRSGSRYTLPGSKPITPLDPAALREAGKSLAGLGSAPIYAAPRKVPDSSMLRSTGKGLATLGRSSYGEESQRKEIKQKGRPKLDELIGQLDTMPRHAGLSGVAVAQSGSVNSIGVAASGTASGPAIQSSGGAIPSIGAAIPSPAPAPSDPISFVESESAFSAPSTRKAKPATSARALAAKAALGSSASNVEENGVESKAEIENDAGLINNNKPEIRNGGMDRKEKNEADQKVPTSGRKGEMVASQTSSSSATQMASSRRQQVSSSSHQHFAQSSASAEASVQSQHQHQQQQRQQLLQQQQQQLQQQQQQVLLDRSNLMSADDDKEILLQRLQEAENRRADLMSKIGETESMIQNMEAQFKGTGKQKEDGVVRNGGTHYERFEESSSHSAHNSYRTDAAGNVLSASSGSSHAHKASTLPATSTTTTTTKAANDDVIKGVGVHSKRDTAERRAKVDKLLMQVASGGEEGLTRGGRDTISSTTSSKKSASMSHAASQSHASQSQSHVSRNQAPYSTLSSVSSSSTQGAPPRSHASLLQTQGGIHSQHEHFVQQQNAQNLTLSESPTPSQRMQRTKSSSSRLNSDTLETRGISMRSDALTPAKSPRIIKKTIRARGGSVDNIHRGNEENVHREVTKTVTYKPVPLQAHTIVINQTKEIIREAPQKSPTPEPEVKPEIVVVKETPKPPEKREMSIQTDLAKPAKTKLKTCDTQTEVEENVDAKKKREAEERDKQHWVNVLYVEPKTKTSPAKEEVAPVKREPVREALPPKREPVREAVPVKEATPVEEAPKMASDLTTTTETLKVDTLNEKLSSTEVETTTRSTEGEQWFTETEEIRWKVITETYADGTTKYYTVREGDDKYVQLGETPGTVETTTTVNAVNVEREKQQVELQRIQQQQQHLQQLQEQQAKLQQQLEAATASLETQEIATQFMSPRPSVAAVSSPLHHLTPPPPSSSGSFTVPPQPPHHHNLQHHHQQQQIHQQQQQHQQQHHQSSFQHFEQQQQQQRHHHDDVYGYDPLGTPDYGTFSSRRSRESSVGEEFLGYETAAPASSRYGAGYGGTASYRGGSAPRTSADYSPRSPPYVVVDGHRKPSRGAASTPPTYSQAVPPLPEPRLGRYIHSPVNADHLAVPRGSNARSPASAYGAEASFDEYEASSGRARKISSTAYSTASSSYDVLGGDINKTPSPDARAFSTPDAALHYMQQQHQQQLHQQHLQQRQRSGSPDPPPHPPPPAPHLLSGGGGGVGEKAVTSYSTSLESSAERRSEHQTLQSAEVSTDFGYNLEYLPIIPTDEYTFRAMADEIRRTMTNSHAILGQLIDVKGKQTEIQDALRDGVKGAKSPGNTPLQPSFEFSGKMGLGPSAQPFREENAAAAAAAARRQSHASAAAAAAASTHPPSSAPQPSRPPPSPVPPPPSPRFGTGHRHHRPLTVETGEVEVNSSSSSSSRFFETKTGNENQMLLTTTTKTTPSESAVDASATDEGWRRIPIATDAAENVSRSVSSAPMSGVAEVTRLVEESPPAPIPTSPGVVKPPIAAKPDPALFAHKMSATGAGETLVVQPASAQPLPIQPAPVKFFSTLNDSMARMEEQLPRNQRLTSSFRKSSSSLSTTPHLVSLAGRGAPMSPRFRRASSSESRDDVFADFGLRRASVRPAPHHLPPAPLPRRRSNAPMPAPRATRTATSPIGQTPPPPPPPPPAAHYKSAPDVSEETHFQVIGEPSTSTSSVSVKSMTNTSTLDRTASAAAATAASAAASIDTLPQRATFVANPVYARQTSRDEEREQQMERQQQRATLQNQHGVPGEQQSVFVQQSHFQQQQPPHLQQQQPTLHQQSPTEVTPTSAPDNVGPKQLFNQLDLEIKKYKQLQQQIHNFLQSDISSTAQQNQQRSELETTSASSSKEGFLSTATQMQTSSTQMRSSPTQMRSSVQFESRKVRQVSPSPDARSSSPTTRLTHDSSKSIYSTSSAFPPTQQQQHYSQQQFHQQPPQNVIHLSPQPPVTPTTPLSPPETRSSGQWASRSSGQTWGQSVSQPLGQPPPSITVSPPSAQASHAIYGGHTGAFDGWKASYDVGGVVNGDRFSRVSTVRRTTPSPPPKVLQQAMIDALTKE